MIVMQAEIPYETVKEVALLANERGKKVYLILLLLVQLIGN